MNKVSSQTYPPSYEFSSQQAKLTYRDRVEEEEDYCQENDEHRQAEVKHEHEQQSDED
jgi:hypothetical protein